MKLYGIAAHNYNASTWYRTIMPFRTAARLGIADVILDDPLLKIPHEDIRRQHAVMYADIVQHYQNYSPGFRHSRDAASKFESYWEDKDKWNFGPNFVWDTDDDLFTVEPLNPAFRDLGVQFNGQIIPKNHQVCIEIPDKGIEVLFQDGKDGFDVEANHKKLAAIRENMKAADLVTCSTPRCASYVTRETQRQDVHVFPNCIDFADWPRVDLAQDDKVRILWQSSSCHFEDMWEIAKVLGEIHRKYENVEILIYGAPYRWLLNQLVPERTTAIGWTDYRTYIWRVSTLNADISIAPLHPSVFNQSRSGIRMYEAAATWKPAATLAERTGPYEDDIIEGETGMLFSNPEEFRTKLEALIEDRTLCRTIASNAKDWVRTNRDPVVHTTKLIEAYQRLRDIRRAVSVAPPPLTPEDLQEDVTVPADDPDLRPGEVANRGASE